MRSGFPVEPQHIERDLPAAVRLLEEHGIGVLNVTADVSLDDERLYSACATAGIGMNRVMFRQRELDYWAAEAKAPPEAGCRPALLRALWGADWRAESLGPLRASQ